MRRLPCFAAILLLSAAPLRAQVEVGPILGAYVPTSDIALAGQGNPFGPTNGKARTSIFYGGIARLWVERRVGLEASILRSSTSVALHGGFGGASTEAPDATVTAGTISALLRFTPGNVAAPIWVAGGVAFVNHGGEAFRAYSHRKSMGGALGAGARVPLGRQFGIDLGLRSLLYSMALQDSLGTLPSRFQIDMTAWAGVVLRLGRSRLEE